MEDRYAMTVARAGPKPKRQVPPGDVCTECGRMTCEACGAEIPAHRVRAHREGRDGARPQCPLQDIRAMAPERERPRDASAEGSRPPAASALTSRRCRKASTWPESRGAVSNVSAEMRGS